MIVILVDFPHFEISSERLFSDTKSCLTLWAVKINVFWVVHVWPMVDSVELNELAHFSLFRLFFEESHNRNRRLDLHSCGDGYRELGEIRVWSPLFFVGRLSFGIWTRLLVDFIILFRSGQCVGLVICTFHRTLIITMQEPKIHFNL